MKLDEIAERYQEIAIVLVEAGAELDTRHGNRVTPIIQAVHFGLFDATKALVEAGADLTVKDKGGKTPLDWALAEGHMETAAGLRDVEAAQDLRMAKMKAPRTLGKACAGGDAAAATPYAGAEGGAAGAAAAATPSQ